MTLTFVVLTEISWKLLNVVPYNLVRIVISPSGCEIKIAATRLYATPGVFSLLVQPPKVDRFYDLYGGSTPKKPEAS